MLFEHIKSDFGTRRNSNITTILIYLYIHICKFDKLIK